MSNRVQFFREVIGKVQVGTNVRKDKLTLSNAVSYPMKAHIDGFGAFLLDGVVAMPIAQILSHMSIVGG